MHFWIFFLQKGRRLYKEVMQQQESRHPWVHVSFPPKIFLGRKWEHSMNICISVCGGAECSSAWRCCLYIFTKHCNSLSWTFQERTFGLVPNLFHLGRFGSTYDPNHFCLIVEHEIRSFVWNVFGIISVLVCKPNYDAHFEPAVLWRVFGSLWLLLMMHHC